jgi:CHAD domain-containing protein
MARAREIPGLEADVSYAEAAQRSVRVRAEELFDHSRDVLDAGDIERLHDMRVASRRLRAALEIYEPCFPAAQFKRALAEVKELADALGERRDRDVSIAALEKFAKDMPAPDQRGVGTMVSSLRAEQEEANRGLETFVEREHLARLRRALSRLSARAG